ncbi:hypothetical protein VE00_00258 [Pseudogymnoascus sp. WSF 3629]|nr:hypothetical protein VE00_00258 [Pseudogymnoascus sp. WSF 3629]
MKLSSHILVAWATATATALAPVPKECGNGLLFGDKAFYSFQVSDTATLNGSLVVPDLVKLNSLQLNGNWYPNQPVATNLTLSTIDFPDLVNTTGQISVYYATNVSSITMPKLKVVNGSFHIGLDGGPAINLTFPSLSYVGAGLMIEGNIDRLEFPALASALLITVESTGDLDCAAFAANVVDKTARFRSTDQRKDAVVCNSNKGSSKMSRPDSGGGPSFRANISLLAIFVSCAILLV